MPVEGELQVDIAEVYVRGRRDGFGIAALVGSLVAFLSLLGAEKAIFAIVLGALAMRGAPARSLARRLGVASVVIGAVFVVSMVVLLLVLREQLSDLIRALERLS